MMVKHCVIKMKVTQITSVGVPFAVFLSGIQCRFIRIILYFMFKLVLNFRIFPLSTVMRSGFGPC